MTAKDEAKQHLAVRRGGRVLLDAAKDNNSGNGEPGWNTDHGHKGQDGNRQPGTGTGEQDRDCQNGRGRGRRKAECAVRNAT
jgi:hypothetical protein